MIKIPKDKLETSTRFSIKASLYMNLVIWGTFSQNALFVLAISNGYYISDFHLQKSDLDKAFLHTVCSDIFLFMF